jgi:hypothetical protein
MRDIIRKKYEHVSRFEEAADAYLVAAVDALDEIKRLREIGADTPRFRQLADALEASAERLEAREAIVRSQAADLRVAAAGVAEWITHLLRSWEITDEIVEIATSEEGNEGDREQRMGALTRAAEVLRQEVSAVKFVITKDEEPPSPPL